MKITATPEGSITLENDACRWGLLELPVRSDRSPAQGPTWTAQAVAQLKSCEHGAKIVNLRLHAEDVAAIYMAIGAI